MSIAINKHSATGFWQTISWGMQRMAYYILITCLVFIVDKTNAQTSIPELWGLHVHDEARILSQATIDELENKLVEYQDSTTNEIAILIIPTLKGEPVEEYSMRVVEKWKLGKKGKDNGVLLLIAVEDHKMRIETGYGIEGVLTDAICSRIIRNVLAPNFRQNQYDQGVREAINAITRAIGGEYTADEGIGTPDLGQKESILIGLFVFGILGVFTFLALVVPGCGGWFLYAFLIPFYAAFPTVIVGTSAALIILAFYVIGFPILKVLISRLEWGKRIAKKITTTNRKGTRGWSSGSGWSMGGGGRSSGGFSGGGGSFGGGGSSGSW